MVAEPGGGRVVAPLATSVTDPLIDLMSTRAEVVDDYLEVRATLERTAAALAATRANDVDRATLRSCMDRIDQAHGKTDPHDEADADIDLHEILLDQHRAIFDAIMARDAAAAGRAAEDHMIYTQRVLSEIAAADARLEISLRRIDGGSISSRARTRSEEAPKTG